MQKKKFSRPCPRCNELIFYISNKNIKKASKLNIPCISCRSIIKYGEMPSELTLQQKEILIGSLLGDGNMSRPRKAKFPGLRILRATKDIDYLEYEYKCFADFCISPIKTGLVYDKRTEKFYSRSSFYTRNVPAFQSFYDQWYPKNKKVLPKNIELTPMVLAIWFLDDGHIRSINNPWLFEIAFSTQSFNKKEVIWLAQSLTDKFKELFRVEKHNSGKGFIIKVSNAGARQFLKYIDGSIPDDVCIRKSNVWRTDEARFYNNEPKIFHSDIFMRNILNAFYRKAIPVGTFRVKDIIEKANNDNLFTSGFVNVKNIGKKVDWDIRFYLNKKILKKITRGKYILTKCGIKYFKDKS